jgi:hypothetical protein
MSGHCRCCGQTVEGSSRRAEVDTNRTHDIGKKWMLAVLGGSLNILFSG